MASLPCLFYACIEVLCREGSPFPEHLRAIESANIRSIHHMLEFFDSIGASSPRTGAVP